MKPTTEVENQVVYEQPKVSGELTIILLKDRRLKVMFSLQAVFRTETRRAELEYFIFDEMRKRGL